MKPSVVHFSFSSLDLFIYFITFIFTMEFFSEINLIFLSFQVFQSIGKADKTKDELFDEHVQNLHKQSVGLFAFPCMDLHLIILFSSQASASKLHKELKSYVSSVKGNFVF